MAYNTKLADRIREHLLHFPQLSVQEKEMFRGLTFMINDKMCISVSGEDLMCRFDPALHETVAEKEGYQPMRMKGKELKGYCYVSPAGFQSTNAFVYWMDLCLAYNAQAKSSKKKNKAVK